MANTGRPRSCTCGECFKCKRADYMREWWNKLTPEQRRKKIAARDPEKQREGYRKRQQYRRANRPELRIKEAARRRVTMAVDRGDLVRPDFCESCGRGGKMFADGRSSIQAHHDDYSKPLDVRWLCHDCHAELHGLKAAA